MLNWAKIRWDKDNLPFSQEFDDKYYADLGFEESCYVSLLQNSLFQNRNLLKPFVVAEVGFGTGLNFLATCSLWIKRGHHQKPLVFISFEKYPVRPEDLKRAQLRWTQLTDFREKFLQSYNNLVPGLNIRYFPEENITLILIIGDLNSSLKVTHFKADHWLLDGFDPKKNQSCWLSSTLKMITDRSSFGATFGTFTAQGHIRRALINYGWDVKKIKGFAFKRHCLVGSYNKLAQQPDHRQQKVFVTGNGIAALSTKYFLSQFNAFVISELYDPPKASNIPYISCYPAFHSHLCDYSLLNLASFSTVSYFYRQLDLHHGLDLQFGLEKLVHSPSQMKKYFKALEIEVISQFISFIKTAPVGEKQFYFPDALSGKSLPIIRFFKENTNINQIVNATAADITDNQYHFDAVVLADSLRAQQWYGKLPYPQLLRGEVKRLVDISGQRWTNPTFDRYSFNPLPQSDSPQSVESFVGFRANLPNHLPIIGKVNNSIYANIYHGSRGYSTGVYGSLLVALESLGIFHFSKVSSMLCSS